MEDLTAELKPIAKFWRKLGKHFGFSEGQLDAIYEDTPWEGPEVCLGSLLDWKRKEIPEFGWEEIVKALVDIGELQHANELIMKHAAPDQKKYHDNPDGK